MVETSPMTADVYAGIIMSRVRERAAERGGLIPVPVLKTYGVLAQAAMSISEEAAWLPPDVRIIRILQSLEPDQYDSIGVVRSKELLGTFVREVDLLSNAEVMREGEI